MKATSSTFLLSVRNTVYNQIISVTEPYPLNPNETVAERLERHSKWRREWKEQWKDIRKNETDQDSKELESTCST